MKVDEVASFKDIQQHDVEISFSSPSSPEWFRNIPGVLTVTPGHGTGVAFNSGKRTTGRDPGSGAAQCYYYFEYPYLRFVAEPGDVIRLI